jgi:adenylate cyclase
MSSDLTVDDLRRCIEGRIPPIIATADAEGEPNVVFISAVHLVDAGRIALSNQFMGKTAANLAANPQASLILVDPHSGFEYRLHIAYERTERRGPTFERLKTEIEEIAAWTGMSDVFRLRSADIYRIERIDKVRDVAPLEIFPRRSAAEQLANLGHLTRRLSRCGDLDTMVATVVRGLDELLGYERSMVMMLDETGERLFTIASYGFETQGVGSELVVGQGAAGQAAERNRPVRLGSLHNDRMYARNSGRAFEDEREIQIPSRNDSRSRLAVPAVSRGAVLGVIVVESPLPAVYDDTDEAVLGIVASIIAEMADLDREVADDPPPPAETRTHPASAASGHTSASSGAETHVRFFASDGSVFLDGDYLIRGVAGRILWSLAQRHRQTGQIEFTNKEIRLDKSLELPGFRDNLDTRIILLKRRLEERRSPIQLDKIGRGRIALRLTGTLRLEAHD